MCQRLVHCIVQKKKKHTLKTRQCCINQSRHDFAADLLVPCTVSKLVSYSCCLTAEHLAARKRASSPPSHNHSGSGYSVRWHTAYFIINKTCGEARDKANTMTMSCFHPTFCVPLIKLELSSQPSAVPKNQLGALSHRRLRQHCCGSTSCD